MAKGLTYYICIYVIFNRIFTHMKATIIELLTTTNKDYKTIAKEVGCSVSYVRVLHKELTTK